MAVPDVIHDPVTDWCACEPLGDDRCDYRMLADAVIQHLNPRDGEEAEVSLLIDAVKAAAAAPDEDVRALGTVDCAHGAPLTVGVWRGHVNIAGRMLDQPAQEEFARLYAAARWKAGHYDRSRDAGPVLRIRSDETIGRPEDIGRLVPPPEVPGE